MNNKRKVIIATILFVFLGLTAFTFANPNEEEDVLNAGNQNNAENNNQENNVLDNEDNNNVVINDTTQTQQPNTNTNTNTNTNNNNQNQVDNSYENALAAVVNAEEKIDENSYNEALTLVEIVTTNKEELINRLEEVRNNIDVKKIVETLETMTNDAANKDDMNDARSYRTEENVISLVDELNNESLKEDLTTRLNVLAKLLDDEVLELNIENGSVLNQNVTIEIEDDNDFVMTLTIDEETSTIENGKELTDGIYTLKAVDKAYNERTITFTVDTTAPTIKLPGTAGRAGNELIVEAGTIVTYEDLLAMVEDATADKEIAPYKADLLIGTASENKYNITDFTNGLDTNYVGRYNVYYTVTDKAGNTTTATMLLVMKDTTAPTIKLPGTAGRAGNELIVEAGTIVTYEDLLAMVEDATADKEIAPYKADLLIGTASENKYNITDFTNGLDTNYVGRYNVYYTVTDKAGNTTTATMLLVMKDTTAPTIKLPGTAGRAGNELIVEIGTVVTYEDLLAMVEDATADKEIAPYKADLLIGTASENKYNITDFTNGLDTNYVGRYNVYYTVTDKAGNTTTATMLLVMKDTVKPVLTAEITAGRTYIRGIDKTHLQFNIYKDGELKHSFNSKTSDAGKYFSLSTGWFGDGEYTIEAIDEGKNKTTIKTLVVSDEISLLKYTDSVKLSKNITLEEVIEILTGQNKIIDLNGYTLTIKNSSSEKPFQNSGNLTIKNGTIVNEESNTQGIIENKENAQITLDNIKITDKGTGTIIKNNGGKVVINNTEITSNKANTTVENISGDLTLTKSRITIKGIKAYALWIHTGNVLVEDTDITAVRGGFNIYGGNITINNVNVKLNNSGTTQSYYAIYVFNKSDSNITINSGTFAGTRAGMYVDGRASYTGNTVIEINGGTFSATANPTSALVFAKEDGASVSLNITGGKFTKTNVTQYLSNGYKQKEDWEVVTE